jgi:hypothetical protein
MILNTRLLNAIRLTGMVQDLANALDFNRPLLWLPRFAQVPTTEAELRGRFFGTLFAADVVQNNQAATVYDAGRMTMVTQEIANLKMGFTMDQETLDRIYRIENNSFIPSDRNLFLQWEQRHVERIVQGIRMRQNSLIYSALLDDTNYSRLGVQIKGTFGLPASNKVTPAVPWSSTSATPISDILNFCNTVMPDTWGFSPNRLTMRTSTLRYVFATTEFQNIARSLVGSFNLDANQLVTSDAPRMRQILGTILDKIIETDDSALREQMHDGTVRRVNNLPTNKVICTSTADDNNPDIRDLGTAPPTEDIAIRLTGLGPGIQNEGSNILAYYTLRDDINPPNATAWAVTKSFPRMHVPEAVGVLTVL